MEGQNSKTHRIAGISDKRAKADFYPTPPHATLELLKVEKFEGNILEPACGEGHISKVLIENGYEVISSDLEQTGYGESGIDFLFFNSKKYDNIITNPPYKLAADFVKVALNNANYKVAMLLKINFLEGVTRREFLKNSPLKYVYVFSRRISLTRHGNPMENKGMITYAWYVWEIGYEGEPIIRWVN